MTALKKINNSTGRRLIVSSILGLAAGYGAQQIGLGNLAILIGWDSAVLIYVVWIWCIIWPMDNDRTSQFALREDPSRGVSDLILILASIASLGAVGFTLIEASQQTGAERFILTSIGVGSIVLSWILIHTIYALQYAMLYYSKTINGSIDFKHDHRPAYSDFAYLAFTIGMTFQVADTDLIGTAFRKTVLKHSLLAYLFGTVIVATTINLIAGLGR